MEELVLIIKPASHSGGRPYSFEVDYRANNLWATDAVVLYQTNLMDIMGGWHDFSKDIQIKKV